MKALLMNWLYQGSWENICPSLKEACGNENEDHFEHPESCSKKELKMIIGTMFHSETRIYKIGYESELIEDISKSHCKG